METILEQQRRYHEERERLMDAMVKEMLHKKAGHRENINSEHRLKMLLDQFMDSTMHLQDLYEDKDGQRKEEVQALSGPNEFSEFYSRLKSIKEFYRRHPNEISVPMSVEFEELAKMRENPTEELSNLVEFTDEEGYGKYLDLHECYQKYINLKGIEKMDYITYLSTFDHLFDIPRERKNAEYQRYAESLLGYLTDYLNRVRPLLDISTEIEEANKDFQIQWEKNTFPGWPKETGSALAHVGAHLELSAFSSWEELASLGLDRLKSALMALGLKCGGTLEERAQRLFSTKGEASLDPNLLAKNRKGKSAKGKDSEKQKEIARFEAHVYKLAELVSSWDGKPIPYWLYKLHGLNISYNCEICGNFTYKGPKAFQRHFAEWRHAHGMRCLGIPNTAHFANVTQIEDALALWEKLKAQKQAERWQPEQEEEFEDSLGNVVNRKTYEDLKRQGLL
ncbi:Splicing factor 3A subunit 3 [Trachymyrmex cornetzi]|uniref:Splicing factor 3A subunit 3 n=1 Tax=Trachymyrmex cornetzi TaxID=471704 RepID=A0A151J1G3_9HYME|nr:Splicing factor 3A subunit 3 [Trachymyrmex cornetzi]